MQLSEDDVVGDPTIFKTTGLDSKFVPATIDPETPNIALGSAGAVIAKENVAPKSEVANTIEPIPPDEYVTAKSAPTPRVDAPALFMVVISQVIISFTRSVVVRLFDPTHNMSEVEDGFPYITKVDGLR